MEEVKQYKDQESFGENNINYVKVQIMFINENVCNDKALKQDNSLARRQY